ncbi:MAG: dTDP-4-dehydrorhamnose 3,5-epimerase [Bacteroidales bacterium]|nr:dTDP-4-dehydrorhamnose 3,5-epimerase [Bacteroidales bacterium]
MERIKTEIPDLYVVEPRVFQDDRGYFFESYNEYKLKEQGLDIKFVQDNESKSQKHVLRGLHFQKPPFAQGKLVRVIKGKVLDVAVDIRQGSPTFGRYHAVEISEENKRMFWIPPGFAHGFVTLENGTIFFYKCTDFYNKESEGSILWNDPELNIQWGVDSPILSEKDQNAQRFSQFDSPFIYKQ